MKEKNITITDYDYTIFIQDEDFLTPEEIARKQIAEECFLTMLANEISDSENDSLF